MTITKHGAMRFKQRQKIKNNSEMRRKVECAIERGKLLKNGSSSAETKCYSFNGFHYIVSDNNERLITVYRPTKQRFKGKKVMLEDIKIKEFLDESRYSISIM